ncbi:hypothetical protein [Lysobacter sp. D1-1-M9]|uniref:hypothetical protein n=1 Tax=Novilysobacter longmucuonensis TaxID=3098603 RepID=UPI002FC67DAF
MDVRILLGCIAALATLIVLALVVHLFGSDLERGLDTALGPLPLADILGVLLAMGAGGWVARRPGFRWLALGLMAAVWLATLAVLGTFAAPGGPAPMRSIVAMLQYNALAIVLTLAAAWLGAVLGERAAHRRLQVARD